jgi:hypothetical protein
MLTADRDLPGFLPALDAVKVARLLEAKVIPRHMELRDLKVERFRYRASKRAIVLYYAELYGSRSGRIRRTWLTGTIYPNGKAQRLAQSLGKSGNLADRPEGLPGAAYISDLGALIQCFPHDRRMPALKEYQGGSSPALGAFLRSQVDSDGAFSPSVQILPVRYRPGLMATLRVSLNEKPAASDDARKTFYVKLRARADSLGIYDRLRNLSETGRQCGFRIVSPVANWEDDRAAVFEAAPGTTFADLICSEGPIDEHARRIGRGLAAFHLSDATSLPRVNGQCFSAKATKAVSLIEWACPAMVATTERILSRLEVLPSPPEPRPTHYDMKPEHIFLDSDGVIHLIDTESVRADDPAIDIGLLLARLDSLEHLAGVPRERIAAAKHGFEEGYFEGAASAWRHRVAAARCYGALLVAKQCIHHLVPGWEARVARELQRASNGLESTDRRAVA